MTSSSEERRHAPRPPAAGKASPHSRFIPREEIRAYATWNLGDLSAPKRQEPPSPLPEEEVAPGPDPLEFLAEQVQAARHSGYQDGYRDGLVALEGFKQSFAHATAMQIGTLIQSVGHELDELQQEMAEAVIATATALARHVVRGELQSHPAQLVKVAQEALETLLLSARHITLRVHPDDHALVAEGAGEVLAARGARLVADPAISRGGCVVQSDIGVIDASIETRWRRAVATLGRGDPWPDPAGAEAEAAP